VVGLLLLLLLLLLLQTLNCSESLLSPLDIKLNETTKVCLGFTAKLLQEKMT